VGQTPDLLGQRLFRRQLLAQRNAEPVEGFCTDVFFDRAKRFIKSENGKPINPSWLTSLPTHRTGRCIPRRSSAKPPMRTIRSVANFFGMIANIDENVGRLRELLQEEGSAENTILIFTTDNGSAAGGECSMRRCGGKGSEYDGGHRVPFFLRWPAGDLTEGRDVTPITAHVDVLPTLIDLCGIAAPERGRRSTASACPAAQRSAKGAKTGPTGSSMTDSQRVKDPIKWRNRAP
jgi:arylsulfatase A-like enzyme